MRCLYIIQKNFQFEKQRLNTNGMYKFILFLLIFLSSCKYTFLVKKENVIHEEKGFIIKTESEMNRDFFIPVRKIRSDYVKDFNTKNLKSGFAMVLDDQILQNLETFESTLMENEMKMSKDSTLFYENLSEFSIVDKFQIYPVEVRYEKLYSKRIEKGSYTRNQSILVNGNIIEFEYLEIAERVLDVLPR